MYNAISGIKHQSN